MKEDENILEEAVEAMRIEQIPPGPPQELVDATVTKLAETQGQSDTVPFGGGTSLVERLRPLRGITRFAAAAMLLIVAGYAAGRISAPRPPDMEQLQAALEPAIRGNVIAQLKDDLQSGLATCYERLSDELGRRHSEDMARFAAQTLDASNSVTSELFTAMIEAIYAAQTEQGQHFTAVIEQMELERRRDTAAFASFAVRTEDKVERMNQGMAQLLSYGLAEGPAAHEFENSDNPDERRDK
ncbi:MAG: hypothetical protein ACYSWQ_29875 [Planctomycetota bacterium]|jgi:hypothetical protein